MKIHTLKKMKRELLADGLPAVSPRGDGRGEKLSGIKEALEWL
jgi:hypothetical protein